MHLKLLGFAAGAILLVARGASAGLPASAVAPATVTGSVTACGPCGGAYNINAAQGDVPLAQYGVNYNITSFIPSLERSGLNTPGELTVSLGGATATESLTANAPSFTATVTGGTAIADPAFYSQGSVPTGTAFDYYIKVINPADPTSTASATIYVTAKGELNMSTSAFPGSYGSFNSGNALTELLITPGPGTTTLERLAQANYSYYTPSGGSNLSTSNVTVSLGPSSSASGGFTLSAFPVTVELDTQYEVELSVALSGSYTVDGTAYVDPIITSPGNDLIFSSGIGDGAVPEPAAWVMMLAGLGLIGGGLRRARGNKETALTAA
jgi:hypothetical protein